jgi:hypothetical protein
MYWKKERKKERKSHGFFLEKPNSEKVKPKTHCIETRSMGRLGASTRRGMLAKAHTLGAVQSPPMSALQSWIVPGQHSSSQIHRKDNFPDKANEATRWGETRTIGNFLGGRRTRRIRP